MRLVRLLLSISAVLGCYMIVSTKRNIMLMRFSRDSYGIYLFHSPLIYIMYMMYPDANPLVMLFVNFIVCGSVGVGIVHVIRVLRLKIINGEK